MPSNTNQTVYYYKLCLVRASTDEVKLLQCLQSNGSFFFTDVYWNVTGRRELKLSVYNDSGYTEFVDCAYKTVLVAGK